MSHENRQHIVDQLPAHLDTAAVSDREHFPTFYQGGFRSEPISPRPLTGVFINALSYGLRRPDEALYSRLNELLEDLANTNSGSAPTAVATQKRHDIGDTRIPVKLCSDAETNFDEAYRQLLDTKSGAAPTHKQLTVYHDDDGEPVIVRKNHEVHTALTAQQVLDTRTGVTMPPGTIVGMSRVREESVTGEVIHKQGNYSTRLRTMLLEPQHVNILPLRLSPWAFSSYIDQAAFSAQGSCGAYYIDERRMNIILDRSLDDFRALGSKILDICGVR